VIGRRRIVVVAGAALTASTRSARAQQPARPARIGFLMTGSLDADEPRRFVAAFRDGLRERGLIEGMHFVIEFRAADGQPERFASLAGELVALSVDVIFAQVTLSARAAQQATKTIPVVVAVMGDPVGDGLAASLARPGMNITGLTFLGPELVPKRMALLKEAVPKTTRVAVLWHPGAFGQQTMDDMSGQTEVAAKSLGVKLERTAVHRPEDIEAAFAAIVRQGADAVLVMPSPLLFNVRRRIVDLAVKHRLPAGYNAREYVELGGLVSYGASLTDLHRRAAGYVERILKGTKPADLPIEQPTKFELVINLKTAKALGITLPQTVLLRADEVIE
jgi:putative ABC transport system substrate-binding protein